MVKKAKESIDALSLGILLLDIEGQVVSISKAADQILHINSSRLGLVNNRLVLKNEQIDQQLQAHISAAIKPNPEVRGYCAGAITLKPSANNQPRMELLISPFNGTYSISDPPVEPLGALVFLKDYGNQVALSAKILSELYDLTSTEVEVCQAMLENRNTQEIADRMSVSTDAVRYHYKNLFKKFGVRRQCELVQLIARSVAGITCDEGRGQEKPSKCI